MRTTRRIFSTLLISISLLSMGHSGALAKTPAAAVSLPASLYPAHSVLMSFPQVSNDDFNCSWAFNCTTGQFLFHTQMAQMLHRSGGWIQAGVWHQWPQTHPRQGASWLIASNTYASGSNVDGGPGSSAAIAFTDFGLALRLTPHPFSAMMHPMTVLPDGVVGTVAEWGRRSPTQIEYAIAVWTGSQEIEGDCVVTAHHGWDGMALRSLRAQVRRALHLALRTRMS